MTRKYTEHRISNSALKQLAAAANREDGSLYPGIGHGAAASRGALIARGLAEGIERRPSCGYHGHYDVVITSAGKEALRWARRDGW